MELGLILGWVLSASGIILIFLSSQGWYINWVKERIPMEKNRLIRGERISGFAIDYWDTTNNDGFNPMI